MGFIRFIRGFFDYNILAEDVINLQIELYNKQKRNHPKLDNNDILFYLWRTRFRQIKSSIRKIYKKSNFDVKDHFGYSQTSLMASLEYPKNVRLLGLYILKEESFESFMNEKNQKYIRELELYIEEVNKLINSNEAIKEFTKNNPNSSVDGFDKIMKTGLII